MPNRVSLQIESREPKPSAKAVIDGLGQCLDALYGPTTDLADVKVVKISMNSPMTLTLEGLAAGIDAFLEAARYLEKPVKRAPKIAIDILQRIESLRGAFVGGVASVRISSGNHRAVLSPLSVEVASEMLRQTAVSHRREEEGQIEGVMEAVFAPSDKRMFRLRDRLTGHTVDCILPITEFAKAKEALASRVLVSGRIRYNDEGQATSVNVGTFQPLPTRKGNWKKWKPVNVTDGMDAADYVRELRDA